MKPYHEDSWLTVWQGDCVEVMAQMEPESVHCVVTSPPYWGLRDYGTATWLGGDEGCDHTLGRLNAEHAGDIGSAVDGQHFRNSKRYVNQGDMSGRTCDRCGAQRNDSQLGLEPTPEEYVTNMVAVFREIRRVLRADGTCWVNLGDSYAGGGGFSPDSPSNLAGAKQMTSKGSIRGTIKPQGYIKPKDLVGIPWRVAFALQADGWYLRSDIIWSKPNPMPESVTDRPTKAHEYLFLLSKSPRYYYDADAVREGVADSQLGRVRDDVIGGKSWQEREQHSEGGRYASGTDGECPVCGGWPKSAVHQEHLRRTSNRNLRSVWSIATQPYPGAHFATFPEKLVEPCVKAGTSERGVCPECGAPWRRVSGRDEQPQAYEDRKYDRSDPLFATKRNLGGRYQAQLDANPKRTTGWQPSCNHGGWFPNDGAVAHSFIYLPTPIPGVVLDPFAGSGTTGRVAQRLGRRAVLIDLNGEYLTQAMKRNQDIPLGLETA